MQQEPSSEVGLSSAERNENGPAPAVAHHIPLAAAAIQEGGTQQPLASTSGTVRTVVAPDSVQSSATAELVATATLPPTHEELDAIIDPREVLFIEEVVSRANRTIWQFRLISILSLALGHFFAYSLAGITDSKNNLIPYALLLLALEHFFYPRRRSGCYSNALPNDPSHWRVFARKHWQRNGLTCELISITANTTPLHDDSVHQRLVTHYPGDPDTLRTDPLGTLLQWCEENAGAHDSPARRMWHRFAANCRLLTLHLEDPQRRVASYLGGVQLFLESIVAHLLRPSQTDESRRIVLGQIASDFTQHGVGSYIELSLCYLPLYKHFMCHRAQTLGDHVAIACLEVVLEASEVVIDNHRALMRRQDIHTYVGLVFEECFREMSLLLPLCNQMNSRYMSIGEEYRSHSSSRAREENLPIELFKGECLHHVMRLLTAERLVTCLGGRLEEDAAHLQTALDRDGIEDHTDELGRFEEKVRELTGLNLHTQCLVRDLTGNTFQLRPLDGQSWEEAVRGHLTDHDLLRSEQVLEAEQDDHRSDVGDEEAPLMQA